MKEKAERGGRKKGEVGERRQERGGGLSGQRGMEKKEGRKEGRGNAKKTQGMTKEDRVRNE